MTDQNLINSSVGYETQKLFLLIYKLHLYKYLSSYRLPETLFMQLFRPVPQCIMSVRYRATVPVKIHKIWVKVISATVVWLLVPWPDGVVWVLKILFCTPWGPLTTLALSRSLSPDSAVSCWTVEVELFFDVTASSTGVIYVSMPQLQSEAKFPLSLTPEQSNPSVLLQINRVNKNILRIYTHVRLQYADEQQNCVRSNSFSKM